MSNSIHIFLSFDAADEQTAAGLQRQISLALQPRELVFWQKDEVPVEAFRAKAAEFLEKADLFVAVLSMHYEDSPDVRWEAAQAIAIQRERPPLQIMTAMARSAPVPQNLSPFPTALPPGERIEDQGLSRDLQLHRAALSAANILAAAPVSNEIGIGNISLPLGIEDLRERLLAQTDRINHAPLLALLKRIIRDVQVKRGVLDVQDSFQHLREKTRLSQISLQELAEAAGPIQGSLCALIEALQEEHLVDNWRQVFIRDYYRFTEGSRDDSAKPPPFFIPVDPIEIPETLNLPVGPSEQESLEQIGLLSFEQKSEFRRRLLLAKDALAVKNPAQAYDHCEYVRSYIDPQSAQLYEYLLITYLQRETPLRAMKDATMGNDRVLQHVLLFASRLREYMQAGKCTSTTALHNLKITSEAISDAALRLYHAFPNDPLRHTGKHSEDVPDNNRTLRIILDNTLKVCRLVHPSEELLEVAVIECCGGGKCNWLARVDVLDGQFQFVPNGHFDLWGEIHELIEMLHAMEAEEEYKIVKGRGLLREDLYFSLLAKRQALSAQLAEDKKRRRPFTDVRESVARFTYSCLLGAAVFGDDDERGRGNSFYRLALEYLLPGLLASSVAEDAAQVRWFTLDGRGEVVPHPECAAYRFDVMGIVQKIVHDHAGKAGWLQVAPNIKRAVYLQYTEDTNALWEKVKEGRSYSDFRRMGDLDARRLTIECLQRWKAAYLAYPDQNGQDFIDCSIREIVGNGELNWLCFNAKGHLTTLPESLALGFDAREALRWLLSVSERYTEEDLRATIAGNIFRKQVEPEYEQARNGLDTQRPQVAKLLLAAMCAYKLHPDASYLDLVWSELSEERKCRWIDVDYNGKAFAMQPLPGFDPLLVANELREADRGRFSLRELREKVANHRYHDTLGYYEREISEYKHENRRTEREMAIAVIRKMKGLFLYYPDEKFLMLPLEELQGKGRVRWQNTALLGLLELPADHFENAYFHFNYKYERFELKRLLDNRFGEMQRVLRETGEV